MDAELHDPKRGLPDLVGHTNASGYGLNKGHRGDESSQPHAGAAGLAGAGALGGAGLASAAHGQHGSSSAGNGGATGLEGGARPAHDSILNTNEQPKELEIGGFNPKTNIDPSVAEPKEVERASTDGPHGLVFVSFLPRFVSGPPRKRFTLPLLTTALLHSTTASTSTVASSTATPRASPRVSKRGTPLAYFRRPLPIFVGS
jgi:hypothetical protein